MKAERVLAELKARITDDKLPHTPGWTDAICYVMNLIGELEAAEEPVCGWCREFRDTRMGTELVRKTGCWVSPTSSTFLRREPSDETCDEFHDRRQTIRRSGKDRRQS